MYVNTPITTKATNNAGTETFSHNGILYVFAFLILPLRLLTGSSDIRSCIKSKTVGVLSSIFILSAFSIAASVIGEISLLSFRGSVNRSLPSFSSVARLSRASGGLQPP